MDLTKEISKLSDTQLLQAFKQIRKYRETGILDDGDVRTIAEKFAKEMGQEDYKFLRSTCEEFLYVMADKYAKSVWIQEIMN